MTAVAAERIGKTYRRYDANRPRTLQEAVMSGFRNMSGGERFWSLRDVSFAVQRGQALGVIGRNGAGKSSLLRILAGISRPDEGTITVRGRVGGLLELNRGLPRRPNGPGERIRRRRDSWTYARGSERQIRIDPRFLRTTPRHRPANTDV